MEQGLGFISADVPHFWMPFLFPFVHIFLALPAYITDHITRFDFGGILFFGCWLLLGHEVVSMLAMDVTCLTTVAYLLLRNIACEGGSIKARDSGIHFHLSLQNYI